MRKKEFLDNHQGWWKLDGKDTPIMAYPMVEKLLDEWLEINKNPLRRFEDYGIFVTVFFITNLDRTPSWKFIIQTVDEVISESCAYYKYEDAERAANRKAEEYCMNEHAIIELNKPENKLLKDWLSKRGVKCG
jgi:hypothetical protein